MKIRDFAAGLLAAAAIGVFIGNIPGNVPQAQPNATANIPDILKTSHDLDQEAYAYYVKGDYETCLEMSD